MVTNVSDSPDSCVSVAAQLTVQSIQKALAQNGSANFVLAGGSLPPAVCLKIANDYATAFDWTKVRFLIGDERICGWDESDSSWRGALPMFAAHPEVPTQNQLRPLTEQSAEAAADAYEEVLESLCADGASSPRLDVVWLGMGEDGHTLSLFPNHPSLNPTDRLVIPVHDLPKPPPNRISFTLSAFNATTDAYIIATGAGKVDILVEAFKPDSMLPIAQVARQIEAGGGTVTWILDQAAAINLQ